MNEQTEYRLYQKTANVAETEAIGNFEELHGEKESKQEGAENKQTTENLSDKDSEIMQNSTDYAALSKAGLVKHLSAILTSPLEEIMDDIESIKNYFYKKHKQDQEDLKAKFLAEGGRPEDFKPVKDELEEKFKELLDVYKKKKAEYNAQQEKRKEENYQEKLQIIEEIKELVNTKESLNKTFQEFRELQNRWKEAGPVPSKVNKELWNSYNLQVEIFYDYIKINRELKDLDLKKNLETKLRLCEKAEALEKEANIIDAFNSLQKYHDQYRETGPVPKEQKEETWQRFKNATTIINKKYQDYFENKKIAQRENLEKKTGLCEETEALAAEIPENLKKLNEMQEKIQHLQETWRTIGFAPKKHNAEIYKRFKNALNQFFDNRREFFKNLKSEQNDNLQEKINICEEAEKLKDSTDWENAANKLKKLQRDWKDAGPVSKKHADKIWKRFRAACDAFFENKSKHVENKEQQKEDNLKQKEELLKTIKEYGKNLSETEGLEKIREFQKQWHDIGQVPNRTKNDVQKEFRETINTLYDKLSIDHNKKEILKFKTNTDTLRHAPNAERKISSEREKILKKKTALEKELIVWENNICFFSGSKNAASLIKDVQEKIENGKNQLQLLKKKLDILSKV